MKKTIELDQDFIDKIVVQELKAYRDVLHKNLLDFYATAEKEPFMWEDINHQIRSIAALDVIIDEYTEPQ